MKKKIAFAMIMGVITTGLISFTLISINAGIGPGFGSLWLRSWMLAYCIVIPAILVFGPGVQLVVDRLFPEKEKL